MESKTQIVKEIISSINPTKRKDVRIVANVYINFDENNLLQKESNLVLHKESIRKIPAIYFKGEYTLDVLLYEIVDRTKYGINLDLIDQVTFKPNH